MNNTEKIIKITFGLLFLFVTAMVLLASNLPFFWDMGYVSLQASFVFEHGFKGLIPPPEINNGNPPAYAAYLAAMWGLFGKSLLVSHLAILPWFGILLYYFLKFSSYFLPRPLLLWAGVFLIADPSIFTQLMYMGHDNPILALFFMALVSLMQKKHLLLACSVILIPLLNARGISFLVMIFIADILILKLYHK